jgi:hypothetical protein
MLTQLCRAALTIDEAQINYDLPRYMNLKFKLKLICYIRHLFMLMISACFWVNRNATKNNVGIPLQGSKESDSLQVNVSKIKYVDMNEVRNRNQQQSHVWS